jgi:hypothetical protein
MDILLILLQPHVVVVIAIAVVFYTTLRPRWRARERSKVLAEQTPALTELAESLGGSLSGEGQASAWSPRLQRSKSEAELSLDFEQRGPWHVRLTEACNPRPVLTDALLTYEHWIEVATVPVPPRKAGWSSSRCPLRTDSSTSCARTGFSPTRSCSWST